MSRVIKVARLEKFTPINECIFDGFYEDCWDTGWRCTLAFGDSKISGYRDYSRIYLKGSQSYADFYVYMSVDGKECIYHGYAFDIKDEFKADEASLILAVQSYAHSLYTKA